MKSTISQSLYYAKVLLFGEYGIMEDAMGLSIPYEHFQGQFKKAFWTARHPEPVTKAFENLQNI